MLNIHFKYKVGQNVFYKNKLYTILSRQYLETSKDFIIKYNLRAKEDFQPNIWESELNTISIIK